ncbi:MAG TPA: M50 family metallopeptidase [Candidatus Melainabacteria bacterium]|nr:M50 family metallopeptidase [Candidatus Melainabacteria bacterium]
MNTNTNKVLIIAALLVMSSLLFGAIVALLIIGVLITLHEFGHWIVARSAGIEVPIFSVGFGPADKARVLGRFSGTEFQLRTFPLGGFVAPESASYQRASFAARAATIAAGPLINLFIAILLFFVLFAGYGVPRADRIKDVYVSGLSESIAIAGQNGVERGDILLSVNGAPIESGQQLTETLEENRLKPVRLTLKRGDEQKTVEVVPNADGKIGIQMAYHLQRTVEQVSLPDAAFYAVVQTTGLIKSTLSGYGDLVSGKHLDQLSSIVGIVAQGGKEVDTGLVEAVNFTAMLSIALAILNALPLPGLDGGQLLLLAFEKWRGRPLSPVVQGKLVAAVIVLFIALTLFALYNDFVWLLGAFWATPAFVVSCCAIIYLLLPLFKRK